MCHCMYGHVCQITSAMVRFQVGVIQLVVRLYVEISHELYLVDYLTYKWTNMVYPFYTTYIRVNLAYYETFRAIVGKGGVSASKCNSGFKCFKCHSGALTVILFSSALNAISCYNMLLLDIAESCHDKCVFRHKCLLQCHILKDMFLHVTGTLEILILIPLDRPLDRCTEVMLFHRMNLHISDMYQNSFPSIQQL